MRVKWSVTLTDRLGPEILRWIQFAKMEDEFTNCTRGDKPIKWQLVPPRCNRKHRVHHRRRQVLTKAPTGPSSDANRITEKRHCQGTIWNTESDKFIDRPVKTSQVTPKYKAIITADLSQNVWPFGIAEPVYYPLQERCSERADWDDQLTKEHLKKWNSLIADLTTLNLVCVPRRYISSKASHLKSAELHCFSHASEGHAQLPFTFAPFTRMGVLMSIGSHPRRKSHR